MKKQTKEQEEPRRVGPKFVRNVLPSNFQIRRPASPMAELLDEAAGHSKPHAERPARIPEDLTPVKITPVKSGGVATTRSTPSNATDKDSVEALPPLEVFIDHVLPRFQPPRQAILLRLYRWSDGRGREMVVSTPKLAAKTNMDEKVCRTHLHALISDGFIERSADHRGHIARFGGSDRSARGLILRLSPQALSELID
jgi:hypothetical protein